MIKILGIVNCTPNSFYDGGKCFDTQKAISHSLLLKEQGADILDIGGESARPYASPVSYQEELNRVIPVITYLSKNTDIPLSIDTQKAVVAKAALEAGASLVNDITGLVDPNMRELVKAYRAKTIIMHMQGTSQTMQIEPSYPRGVVVEIIEWFEKRLSLIHNDGISKEQIIIDPGIGFGKTCEHNLEILSNLSLFCQLGYPVLIGLSRKSFMQKILQKEASEVLSTTIALNTMSVLWGASLIRVHDVAEHRQVIDFLRFFNFKQRMPMNGINMESVNNQCFENINP